MRFKLLLLFFLFCIGLSVKAQKEKYGFNLEIDAPHYKGSTIYLLSYWDSNTYIQDSCLLSPNGKGSIRIEKPLPTGQYIAYIKPDVRLELLLDKEQSDLKISVSKDIINSKISGSKDTEALWNYIRISNKQIEAQNKIQEKLNDNGLSETKRNEIIKEAESLNQQASQHIQKLIDDNKGTWAGDFIRGTQPISVPYKKPATIDERKANSEYTQKHYFDNMSLSDPRFLRTSYFHHTLDNYMENHVVQEADSIAFAASKLVSVAQGDKLCFDQMLMRFINNSISSNRMGMENTWAKLVEDYIFDKEIVDIDSMEVFELRKKYQLIKDNRIGMTAHNIRLEKLSGDTLHIHDIDAEYIILYFFDPNCSHCKVETASIQNNLYPKYKDRGLKIVSVNIHPEVEAWRNYIEKYNLSDWINCADPQYKSQFWMHYNTSAVPSVYILDKNKKIIAKNIDEKNMEVMFKHLYKENGTN